MKKRLLPALLALVMVLGMLPMTVFATPDGFSETGTTALDLAGGKVEGLTETSVVTNENTNEVTVTVSNATLNHFDADNTVGRSYAGWFVGAKITMPTAGKYSDAKFYGTTLNANTLKDDSDVSEADTFIRVWKGIKSTNTDGALAVDATDLATITGKGTFQMDLYFDWDGLETTGKTVTKTVDNTEKTVKGIDQIVHLVINPANIKLMNADGTKQIYPTESKTLAINAGYAADVTTMVSDIQKATGKTASVAAGDENAKNLVWFVMTNLTAKTEYTLSLKGTASGSQEALNNNSIAYSGTSPAFTTGDAETAKFIYVSLDEFTADGNGQGNLTALGKGGEFTASVTPKDGTAVTAALSIPKSAIPGQEAGKKTITEVNVTLPATATLASLTDGLPATATVVGAKAGSEDVASPVEVLTATVTWKKADGTAVDATLAAGSYKPTVAIALKSAEDETYELATGDGLTVKINDAAAADYTLTVTDGSKPDGTMTVSITGATLTEAELETLGGTAATKIGTVTLSSDPTKKLFKAEGTANYVELPKFNQTVEAEQSGHYMAIKVEVAVTGATVLPTEVTLTNRSAGASDGKKIALVKNGDDKASETIVAWLDGTGTLTGLEAKQFKVTVGGENYIVDFSGVTLLPKADEGTKVEVNDTTGGVTASTTNNAVKVELPEDAAETVATTTVKVEAKEDTDYKSITASNIKDNTLTAENKEKVATALNSAVAGASVTATKTDEQGQESKVPVETLSTITITIKVPFAGKYQVYCIKDDGTITSFGQKDSTKDGSDDILKITSKHLSEYPVIPIAAAAGATDTQKEQAAAGAAAVTALAGVVEDDPSLSTVPTVTVTKLGCTDKTVTTSLEEAVDGTTPIYKLNAALSGATGFKIRSITATVDGTPIKVYYDETNGYSIDKDAVPEGKTVALTVTIVEDAACVYMDNAGLFKGQLKLTGLQVNKKYVLQMAKKGAAASNVGNAIIILDTTGEDVGEGVVVDVLKNESGYTVSLWQYEDGADDVGELVNVFYEKDA